MLTILPAAALIPPCLHPLHRWRPTSCARIGVVSIGGSAPVPQIPATSSAATVTPQAPNPPPQNNNWNNVEALQKEDARENTQELPLISQCGGEQGNKQVTHLTQVSGQATYFHLHVPQRKSFWIAGVEMMCSTHNGCLPAKACQDVWP
jgi:hypothetical protein